MEKGIASAWFHVIESERYMPKRHQQRPSEERVGRNFPAKSTPIPAGTPKKEETYKKQAFAHENPGQAPPLAQPPASWRSHPGLTRQGNSRALTSEGRRRSGSESNAHSPRKSSRLHPNANAQPQQHQPDRTSEYQQDLAVSQRPASEMGMGAPAVPGEKHSAYEFKELYAKLADLTDDELKQISILPTGTRLEQGSRYIDLNHLERGEFVAADASTVAGPENYYVPKKETDYVLWNRLNQVDNPARLDERVPEG